MSLCLTKTLKTPNIRQNQFACIVTCMYTVSVSFRHLILKMCLRELPYDVTSGSDITSCIKIDIKKI